jgi:trans-aconitate methyltransferase
MSFNPNQLLNTPRSMLNPMLVKPNDPEEGKAPVTPPPFDQGLYLDAYGRLGMLSIENVADLGCGAGNFVSVMTSRNQRPEVYIGIDNSHSQISIAKAAYPGWKFIYGDFNNERVKAEYERYEAYLLLHMVDTAEDDIAFLMSMPAGKPLVFSIPKFEKEGSKLCLTEGRDIHERYSSFLSIKNIGRYRCKSTGDSYSMVVAARW